MTNEPNSPWQPIATAPHDEQVLVFSSRWGAMIATYRSDFSAWFSRMQCPASLHEADMALITHWMPLPPCPDVASRMAMGQPPIGLAPSLGRFVRNVSSLESFKRISAH